MDSEMKLPEGLTTNGQIARRYGARLIDSFVLIILVSIVAAILASIVNGQIFLWQVNLISYACLIVYGALLESSEWQGTIGKKLLSLRVYDQDGTRLPVGKAFARAALKEIPFFALSLLPPPMNNFSTIGLLIAHIAVVQMSPLSQAIHDKILGTWVAAPEAHTQMHLT